MLWIRFKRWPYLTRLAPHVVHCASGRRYLWTNADEGVTGVLWKADAEDLLNPPNDTVSPFEVAWERYGLAFDAQGKVTEDVAHDQHDASEGDTPVRRGPGRPKKR